MDPEQASIECRTRRQIAVVASVFGVLFMFAGAIHIASVVSIVGAIATSVAVGASYLVRNVMVVWVVQPIIAFATLLVASETIGSTGIVGVLLVAYSASARVRWTPPFS